MLKKYFLGVLIGTCVLAGCDSNEEPVTIDAPQFRQVADSSYVVTESGLKYYDFAIGDTTRVTADSGDVVLVDYFGWLEDGALFDTSTLGAPFQFILGSENVIDGWNEGISGMYLGGERQLVIPPDLAYGSEGNSGIPGNTTLIFEVELLGTE